MQRTLQLLTVGTAGAVIADWLGIPAGLYIGPLLSVAALKLLHPRLGKAPTAFKLVGSTLLGTAVGSTFNRPLLERMGSLLLPTIGATLAIIAISIVLGWVLSRLTGLDLGTALFSLTPGGVAEMVAAAQDTKADITAVTTLQLVRLSSVLLLAPAIIAWLFSGGR